MDQAEFNELMRRADAAKAATDEAKAAVPEQAPEAAPTTQSDLYSDPGVLGAAKAASDATRNNDKSAERAGEAAEAFATGTAKSAFEVKDFLFGDTPRSERSNFRARMEDRDAELRDGNLLAGFSSGVGQFAGAMIGIGKATAFAKALPWFGKGLGAVIEAAPKTAEVLKAAAAGAIGFDPHEERLSNLIQTTPLANPVNAWLAADPNDTAAEGRVKAALESIGLDAAIIGTFVSASRVWKSLRTGDAEGASRAVDQMEAEKNAHIAAAEEAQGIAQATPQGGPGQGAAPAGDPRVDPGSPTPNGPASGQDTVGGEAAAGDPVADEWAMPDESALADAEPDILAVREKAAKIADPIALGSLGDSAYDLFDGVRAEARAVEKRLLQKYGVRKVDQLDDAPLTPAERFFLFHDKVPTDPQRLNGLREVIEPVEDLNDAATELHRVAGNLPTDMDNMTDPERLAVGRLVFLGKEIERLGGDHMAVIKQAVMERAAGYADPEDAEFSARYVAERIARFMDGDVPPPKQIEGPKVVEEGVSAERPTIAANPTDAAKAAGATLPPSPLPGVRLADEDTEAVLKSMADDAAAIEKHGGWYQAIEAGHTFGRGEKVPYAKLNTERDVDDFLARVVDVAEEQLDRAKGGAVLSDAKLDRVVDQMARLFNADPAAVLGMVQKAGKDASTMVANMEAGYLVSNKMLGDTFALGTRIRLGDYSEFGSRAAAMAAFKKRIEIASSVYGAARSMTAASGRALRRMRLDFAVDPEAVAKLNTMDPERMLQLVVDTEGDPRALARIVGEPGLWEKTKDFLQFLYVNNLVSGWKTQVYNMMANGYMVGVRPLERVIGATLLSPTPWGRGQGRVFKESLKQYTYLGSAFTDGFQVAAKAFLHNDSILAPHRTEAYRGNQAAARALGPLKPWTSPGNILHNALSIATLPIGLPTRSLGAVDELVKQTVYRSKVLAAAHLDVTEEAVTAGLTGKALRQYVEAGVRARLDNAFDELGRALDPDALREAQVATFQNELTPGSIGKWFQTGVSQNAALRLVLPFVKTPTNVIRYGWKLTPMLNLLQTEYRAMLTGQMGAEARAQATGQMMMGGLFMGAAAFAVSQGTITGGGPKDYKALETLKATGWQPYSVVVEHDDGTKTYLPFNRLDPVAIPFGVMADLMDALHILEGDEDASVQSAIGGLLVAVSRQFTSKTYLTGVQQFLDFITEAGGKDGEGLGKSAERYVGQTLANFIPYSAMLRQTNPDPYLREARDISDKVLSTIPGFSSQLPAKYDAWGDPMRVRTGLWSAAEDQEVDLEVQRLILEGGGQAVGRPQPVRNGVDLREITMSDGKNAYEEYQRLAGHPPGKVPLKHVVARRMRTERYKMASDGEVGTRGTKLWLLHPIFDKYRTAALKRIKRDPVVRDAFRAAEEKVRDEYRAKQQGAKPASPMKKLGASFGLDLEAL